TRVDSDAAESRTFPAGTAVISTRQPLGGLVQTLLEKSPTFSKGFLEEQRQKTQADESDDFYDLTSWSLPLAMNVEAFVTTADVDGTLERISRDTGAAFVPLASGWLGGAAFGSEKLHFVRDPKIALVGGSGVGANSYGMLWYTLDIDTPVPHSTVSIDALRG